MYRKLTIFLFCIIGSHLSGEAQNTSNTIIGKVSYQLYHKYDKLEERFLNYPIQLYFGDSISVFKFDNKNENTMTIKSGINEVKFIPPSERGTKDLYYTSLKKNSITRERFYINQSGEKNTFLMNEPIEKIQWTIQPERKLLDTFHCQKATCNFRGRDYIAWFSKDLPYSLGPWKLNGLPGLILEAFDTEKEVVYSFIKYEPSQGIIEIPKHFIAMKEIEFEKMKLGELNSDGYTNSFVSVSIEIQDRKGEPIVNKAKRINNPIDLSTKMPYTF
jgi:GLPGLI family protein